MKKIYEKKLYTLNVRKLKKKKSYKIVNMMKRILFLLKNQ